jgi:hypothetical protein
LAVPDLTPVFNSTLVAAESVLTLAWMRVALRVAPHRVLRAAVRERASVRAHDPQLVRLFGEVAASTAIGNSCMHRSLALQRLLARRGVHARLCLGIGEKPRLELGGEVINDAPEMVARYRRLHT